MDLALVIGIVSLLVSIVLAVVLVRVLRRDRSNSSNSVLTSSTTLSEAERVANAIGPLLATVQELNSVVVDGRVKYEARIAQLQAELDKATGKSS